MPVTINEFESRVEVEPEAANAEATAARAAVTASALQLWQALSRRQAEIEARTAAWGFDD